jgi:hypothetical protein
MDGKVARGGRGLTYLRHGTFKIDPETWIISVDYTFGFDWEFEALVHVFVDQMADLGLDLECCVLVAVKVEQFVFGHNLFEQKVGNRTCKILIGNNARD